MSSTTNQSEEAKMTRTFTIAIAAALLIVGLGAQTQSNAPSDQGTNFWVLSIAKEAEVGEKIVDLHNPRAVTVCHDGQSPVSLSIDGKHWHSFGGLPYAGASVGEKCQQVPPVRFVKLERHINKTLEESTVQVYATY
jgi:hypothetical protein